MSGLAFRTGWVLVLPWTRVSPVSPSGTLTAEDAVLNDRERNTLDGIERELTVSDPAFVRQFTGAHAPRIGGPALLLTIGLAVMVGGSALVSVGIAAIGMAVATVALVAGCRRSIGFGTA